VFSTIPRRQVGGEHEIVCYFVPFLPELWQWDDEIGLVTRIELLALARCPGHRFGTVTSRTRGIDLF